MSPLLLTQLPLTYADSFVFENSGFGFQIKITNIEQQLVILLKNVLTFNFSNESLHSSEDWLDIIDITHEYRKPMNEDLRKYSFAVDDSHELPPLHIITLYGNTEITVLCEEVEVKKMK